MAGGMTQTLFDGGARGAIVVNGLAACLLCGLAIQMKYTPAIEGAFFGCVHIRFLWRAGVGIPATVAAAIAWVLAGFAATLAAIATIQTSYPNPAG